MACFVPRLLSPVCWLLAAALLPSCKNKHEAAASELDEAGYQLTAADWFRACRENNIEALKKFIAGGFPIATKDDRGNAALHVAAAAGARKSADFLLNRKLPIDAIGANGRTPLMAAVAANQTEMVGYLLRQGADPKARDAENFKPLMLAVREGSAGSVAELAACDRQDLDPALLLAALLGQTSVIDSLTCYGASVYARMEDGRTPLMLAAGNGWLDSVRLLVDLGSSRHAVDSEGNNASALATRAGHPEIANLLDREPKPDELALESPQEVAVKMDAFVVAATEELQTVGLAGGHSAKPVRPSRSIAGAVLGMRRSSEKIPASPVVMRHYREGDVPIEVMNVSGDTATFRIHGSKPRDLKVRAGENLYGSRLTVIRAKRRIEDSKVTDGKPLEVSVAEISDRVTGVRREWISGRPPTSHDPIALIEDPANGERYTATQGQRFTSAEGVSYLVTDVRPNQIVISNESDGSVQTIPLSGPRG